VSTSSSSKYANLTIIGIDEVINLPPTLSAFATQNASSIGGILTSSGLGTALQSLKGVTVFLPTNEAVAKLGPEAIAALNQTTLETILQNHVVNNTVAYSTSLGGAGDVISLAGEKFTFNLKGPNGTATVTSGNVTANIVYTDIIVRNGVVHLIDTVLANPASNPQAVQSVISVAATASKTSDAGTGPTAGPSGSAGAGAGGGNTGAAAPLVGGGALKGVMVAVIVGAVAMVWV
jgi:uncharacterized surface protein with fasciclin (FAS1) repeats